MTFEAVDAADLWLPRQRTAIADAGGSTQTRPQLRPHELEIGDVLLDLGPDVSGHIVGREALR